MTEDILISVRGLHTLDTEQEEEQTDELEMTMPGKYYFRNGKHYVLFEETDEESQSVVKNRFKLAPDRLEISKKGATNTTMTFQRGEKSSSWYGTPVGDVQLGIEVTEMELTEGEDEIEMNVAYALEMNSEHVSDARIRLRIIERNKGLFRI
ncbi:MAG: DUF1934 domain-containing protein [Lachnospiraceae bacterium]|nr:DUF1934 domain-containing protein [Lachnospiraceae bacterium]